MGGDRLMYDLIDEDIDEALNCDHSQYPESRKFGGWIICSNCGTKLGEWR